MDDNQLVKIAKKWKKIFPDNLNGLQNIDARIGY